VSIEGGSRIRCLEWSALANEVVLHVDDDQDTPVGLDLDGLSFSGGVGHVGILGDHCFE
jgi:hypothetical protein